MMQNCKNKNLLDMTYKQTVSCSNPSRVSGGKDTVHCGHCLPCVIRRAAIYKFTDVDNTNYHQLSFNDSAAAKSMLNAFNFFRNSLNNYFPPFKIQENGPIKNNIESFVRVFNQGAQELFNLLDSDNIK